MNKKYLISILSVILILMYQLVFAGNDPAVFRRFGFFIGSNNGGAGLTNLEYADSDAEEMAATMEDIGGIKPSDIIILKNPKIDNVFRGFKIMTNEISLAKKDNKRIEFLLYYSGHSDETGLLFNGRKLKYKELRRFIKQVGADVSIAILDSCSSGSFTRIKGGKRISPFLIDESVKTEGHAFLTSSSENEVAQESDSIGGSFFTHYLISALRGAADTTLDDRVTLNEAYSYASAETLARTENTIGGAQHPAYDINLTGSGDLVLTDLRASSAVFLIEKKIQGRLFIRDSKNRLTAELHKVQGIPVTLALPPGRYSITLENGGTAEKADLRLPGKGKTVLQKSDFRSVSREPATARGSESGAAFVHKRTKITLSIESETSGTNNVLKSFSLNLFDYSKTISGIETGLMNIVLKSVRGIQIAAVGNNTGGEIKGVQAAGIYNISGENITGWQTAGIFNITDGNIKGGQYAGIFNLTNGDVSYFQGAGVFNINRRNAKWFQGAGVFNLNMGGFDGFQGAGVFNINRNSFRGFQGAGVFNLNIGRFDGFQGTGVASINRGNFNGFQGAGVASINRGDFNGFQGAGLVSIAANSRGTQSGLVNITGDVNGIQLGLINIGRNVHGAQVGLVNINNDIRGIPIGLVNVSMKGLHNLNSWSDAHGVTYFGLQLGTRYLYSLFYGGFPISNSKNEFAAGFGAGFHIPLFPFYFDIDLSGKYFLQKDLIIALFTYSSGTKNLSFISHPSLRIAAGFKIFHSLALFGGVMFDTKLSNTLNGSNFFYGKPAVSISPSFFYSGSNYKADFNVEIYTRWFIGIRL
ncbi:MAG: caspase family protein [Spirochaetes bacterium]|nr:caspase family protein [Spirochaetota bacterium]